MRIPSAWFMFLLGSGCNAQSRHFVQMALSKTGQRASDSPNNLKQALGECMENVWKYAVVQPPSNQTSYHWPTLLGL